MSTGKKIAIGVILTLSAIGIGVGIFFGLKQADAKKMAEKLKLQSFQYEAQIEIDQQMLSDSDHVFLGMLMAGTGLGQEELYHPDVKGCLDGDCLYAEIFLQNVIEPLTELYMGSGQTYLNCEMIYEQIRSYITEKVPLMRKLMGEWKDGAFISLNQFQQLTGTNQQETQTARFSESLKRVSSEDIYRCLLLMKKTREGEETVYTLKADGLMLQCRAKLDTDDPARVWIDIDQPSEKRAAINKKLSPLSISFPESSLDKAKHITIDITCRESKVSMPTDFMDHSAIDNLKALKDILTKLMMN